MSYRELRDNRGIVAVNRETSDIKSRKSEFCKTSGLTIYKVLDLTEILRALGFPRLVSVDNFRCPNFALMAEVLEWAVSKFDPNVRIPKRVDSETDRVIFVKTCVMTLIQKAHVLLNPKNLYQSDGMAARELLILLRMLYNARQERSDGPSDSPQTSEIRTRVNSLRQDVRRSTQLAAQLPHAAANIYDLLRKEIAAKEERSRVLSQALNIADVERELGEMIAQIEKRTTEMHFKLSNISSDEQDLEHKIERRRREYEQLQKRLAKLQSFRPPYMDEYERYETQLKQLYTVYVVLFRNLSHLQHQLWEVERLERERMLNAEQNIREAVDKMRLENDIAAVPSILGDVYVGDEENAKPKPREVKVVGNMLGAGLSDDDDDDEDLDDENDPNYDDEDDRELNAHGVRKERSFGGPIGEEHTDRRSTAETIDAQARGLEAITENEDEEEDLELGRSDDDF